MTEPVRNLPIFASNYLVQAASTLRVDRLVRELIIEQAPDRRDYEDVPIYMKSDADVLRVLSRMIPDDEPNKGTTLHLIAQVLGRHERNAATLDSDNRQLRQKADAYAVQIRSPRPLILIAIGLVVAVFLIAEASAYRASPALSAICIFGAVVAAGSVVERAYHLRVLRKVSSRPEKLPIYDNASQQTDDAAW